MEIMSIDNKVNFGATLKVGKYVNNKPRWLRIAKKFEKITKNQADVLEIKTFKHIDNPNNQLTEIRFFTNPGTKRERMHFIEMTNSELEYFLTRLDDAIANKLKKLLKLFRRHDNACIKNDRFIKRMAKERNIPIDSPALLDYKQASEKSFREALKRDIQQDTILSPFSIY